MKKCLVVGAFAIGVALGEAAIKGAIIVQPSSQVDASVTGAIPTTTAAFVTSPFTSVESDNFANILLDDSVTATVTYSFNGLDISGTLNHSGPGETAGDIGLDGGSAATGIFFTVDQSGTYAVSGGIAGPNDGGSFNGTNFSDSTGYQFLLEDLGTRPTDDTPFALIDDFTQSTNSDFTYVIPDNSTVSLVPGDTYEAIIDAGQTFSDSNFGSAAKVFQGSLTSIPEPGTLTFLVLVIPALCIRRRNQLI
jgi:hypothetical protein